MDKVYRLLAELRLELESLGAPFAKMVGRDEDENVLWAVVMAIEPATARDVVTAVEGLEELWEKEEERESTMEGETIKTEQGFREEAEAERGS
jgi:hypothetical protein